MHTLHTVAHENALKITAVETKRAFYHGVEAPYSVSAISFNRNYYLI